jgi:Na+/H+ antiporter NhaD/arsenite permease-like protein
VVVYLGMLLGEIPGLALDRTGVALLGALTLVASEDVTPAAAWAAVDVPTLALLFRGHSHRQPPEHADRADAAPLLRRLSGRRGRAGRPRTLVVWALVLLSVRGRWEAETPVPAVEAASFDRWQATKGLAVLALLVLGFLFAPVPREVLALGAAALLLTSRRMASRDVIGLVDWHLLVLFIGLFVVNHAVAAAG